MSEHKPLVSIIVPAYQAERTLGATLSSCLTQTYSNIEIVVTNDGSTDRTIEIARAHGVKIVDQPNAGLPAARNAAMAAASGDLFLLCDSDDQMLPPAVESMVDLYLAAGGGRRMVTSQAYFLTPTGINPRRQIFPMQHPRPADQRLTVLQTNWLTVFTLFPRTLVDEVGGFDTELRSCEDWEMWIRAVFAGYEVIRQPKPYFLYRWTGGSMSTQQGTMYAAEDLALTKVRDRESAANNLRADEQAYLDLRLGAGSPRELVGRAETALREGRAEDAKRHFDDALKLTPHNRKLQIRARSMHVPGAAWLWGKRQQRIDAEIGWNESMKR